MRATAFGVIAGLAMLFAAGPWGAGPAAADNGPHVLDRPATTDACAGCHRAHTAQGAYLLKADELSLCLTCHDGSQALTNVVDGIAYTTAGGSTVLGALYAGGFTNARINAEDPTWCNDDGCGGGATGPFNVTIGVGGAELVTSSHSVNGSAQTIWGNGAISASANPGVAGLELECSTCHNPHGNGQFRILRPRPIGELASPLAGAVDRDTAGIVIADVAHPGTGAEYVTINYFTSGATALNDWCAQCHSRYRAPTASGHTSSGDAIFTYRHATTPTWAPKCVQCHVAHGTNAVSNSGDSGFAYAGSVPWPGGSPAPVAATNSRLLKMDNRGICQKCHYR